MLFHFKLALPVILAALAEPMAAIIDTALVGHLGTDELAGMAIAVVILSTFGWVFNFLVHRPTASISWHVSAKNWDEVATNIKLAFTAAMAVGISVGLLLFLFAGELLHFTGASDLLIQIGTPYFNARLIGYPFFIGFVALAGITRGLGNTFYPLVAVIVMTVINVSLSALSLYVFRTGIVGVGVATSLSFIIGFFILLIWIIRHCKAQGIDLFNRHQFNWSAWASFGRDSSFIFMRTALLSSSIYVCTPVVARLGNSYLAALQIIAEIWLFSSIVIDGYGTIGNMKAAEALGKRQYGAYKRLLRSLVGLGLISSAIMSVMLWIGQDLVIGVFTSDPSVIFILKQVYPLLALAIITQSVPDVCDGILYGANQYKFAGFMMLTGVILIFAPILAFAYAKETFILVLVARAVLAVYRGIAGYWRLSSIYPAA